MYRLLLVLLTAVLATPEVAQAAEGMPQLAFNNPLVLSQVVWMAVIFVALYLLLARWALPQVKTVLDTREATIQSDLETARGAKARADAAVREQTEASNKARAEAQASINSAADEAKRQAATQTEALNARLDEQLKAAEARIAAARGSAMGALRQVAVETANTVVSRLTGQTADSAAIEQAVGSALSARAQPAA